MFFVSRGLEHGNHGPNIKNTPHTQNSPSASNSRWRSDELHRKKELNCAHQQTAQVQGERQRAQCQRDVKHNCVFLHRRAEQLLLNVVKGFGAGRYFQKEYQRQQGKEKRNCKERVKRLMNRTCNWVINQAHLNIINLDWWAPRALRYYPAWKASTTSRTPHGSRYWCCCDCDCSSSADIAGCWPTAPAVA